MTPKVYYSLGRPAQRCNSTLRNTVTMVQKVQEVGFAARTLLMFRRINLEGQALRDNVLWDADGS